jgi:hypothetical protein
MAVITQAEARVYLPGLSADDSTVATLITRADAILAGWCGYPAASEGGLPTFEDVTFTHYLPGHGGRVIQLPVWPVVSITSVQDDPTEAFDGSTYLVASGDYSIRPRGELRLDLDATHGAWSDSGDTEARPIKVVYVAGFTSPPEDLKGIVAEYVAVLWAMRMGSGKASVNTPSGATAEIPSGEIPVSIRQRLRRFELTSAMGEIP